MQSYQIYKNEYNKYLKEVGEVGYVELILPPVVYIKGLPNVHYMEVVYFETGEMGMVLSINPDRCEVLVFAKDALQLGTQVSRSNETFHIPVGDEFLGQSVDPLGRSTSDDVYIPKPKLQMPLEKLAPGIDQRVKIKESFETGVTVVDMMIPLGKGQRELVIGDRKTGKTEFLMQVLLTQARKGAICIYTGIGKKKGDVRRVESFVKNNNISTNTIIVSTSSTDPLGMIYITPYAAMTLAEYFADKGKDVLLIYDDLTTHAKFYREIALIGKRFPGRNSYPGDVFFSHSRLLERAGCFKTSAGVSSITCLAGAETIASDMSGYIQTNLMSITDGHIYFDQELFEQGRRPAVNFFVSVTRVGRQTQTKLRWGVNRELNSFMTLYEKTQKFIHFGAEINEGIRATLSMGNRILSFFDQPMGKAVSVNIQIVVFCLIWVGLLGEIDNMQMRTLLDKALKKYESDESFRNLIDGLIKDCNDFNVLLGKVSSKGTELLPLLEYKPEVSSAK